MWIISIYCGVRGGENTSVQEQENAERFRKMLMTIVWVFFVCSIANFAALRLEMWMAGAPDRKADREKYYEKIAKYAEDRVAHLMSLENSESREAFLEQDMKVRKALLVSEIRGNGVLPGG